MSVGVGIEVKPGDILDDIFATDVANAASRWDDALSFAYLWTGSDPDRFLSLLWLLLSAHQSACRWPMVDLVGTVRPCRAGSSAIPAVCGQWRRPSGAVATELHTASGRRSMRRLRKSTGTVQILPHQIARSLWGSSAAFLRLCHHFGRSFCQTAADGAAKTWPKKRFSCLNRITVGLIVIFLMA